ncbi:MAG: ABC transporter permease [Vicinamibacterales bacterium]
MTPAEWSARLRVEFERSGAPPDDDVVEELAQHAAAAFATARAEGLSPDDAERRVGRLIAQWTDDEAIRRRRPARLPAIEPPSTASSGLSGLALDLRFGARMLRRERGPVATAILTIALGIGAATTLASVAYHVLLQPLPWPNASRLVQVSETREGATRAWPGRLTNGTYLAWREHPETIDALASWTISELTIRTADGAPERARIARVTASLFDVLDARPAIGRLFSPADERASAGHVAVLSFGFWQRQFGGRDDVVGRTLDFDGGPVQIVGVMPATFAFPDHQIVLWTPREVPPVIGPDDHPPERVSRRLSITPVIARLRPGVTPAQASVEATARSRTAPDPGPVAIAMYGSNGPATVSAVPMAEAITSDVRPALLLLITAIALLFAAAVANVASLQLARTSTRVREIAIRTTLGATGTRIARQLFVENLLVGAIGGAGGLVLTFWLHRLLPAILPADFPRSDAIAIDGPVVAMTLALTVSASVAFGWLPFLLARRISTTAALSEDGSSPAGGGLRTRVARTRAIVMAAQVAVAAILLLGAALLSRSISAMLHVDRGYQPEHLLTARLPLDDASFTPQSRATLVQTVVERAAGLPGVTHAAMTTGLPLTSGEGLRSFPLPSLTPGRPVVSVHTSSRAVSADYFAAAGMRVVEGRGFTPADSLDSRPVLVVNREFAREYLPTPATGTELSINLYPGKERWLVAGVVDDVREQSATDPFSPEMYECVCQIPGGLTTSAPSLLLRTAGDPASYIPTLQRLVREIAPSVALDSVMTMEDRMRLSLAKPRLYAVLLDGFGGFALLLAGVGLFGVLSQGVARRRREIGVRTALGAKPGDVALLILRQGLGVTAIGLLIGLGAALALGRLIGEFLFGVAPYDPISIALVTALLLAVAALACYVPARRAARLDPLKALRS